MRLGAVLDREVATGKWLFYFGLRTIGLAMKQALELINRMQADGVIDRYAIGGAVGATLYLEPAATLHIDIFVTLPGSTGSVLVSLTPIYAYLKQRGGRAEGEHMVIGAGQCSFCQ